MAECSTEYKTLYVVKQRTQTPSCAKRKGHKRHVFDGDGAVKFNGLGSKVRF